MKLHVNTQPPCRLRYDPLRVPEMAYSEWERSRGFHDVVRVVGKVLSAVDDEDLLAVSLALTVALVRVNRAVIRNPELVEPTPAGPELAKASARKNLEAAFDLEPRVPGAPS